MPSYVPSQVVELIDSRLPAARKQCEGGPSFLVGADYAGLLALLLRMVDNIPEHLLVLRGDDAIEFGEAIEAIRIAVARWHAGDKSYFMQSMAARQGWSAITFVRKHAASLPDEAAVGNLHALTFIADLDLRASLAIDLKAMEDALDRRAWKSATLLAGSVTEALLLGALLQKEADARREGGRLPSPAPTDLTDWNLHQLTEVANVLGVIEGATAAQCRVAKNFRNLIHPGRALRLAQDCDRGTAFATTAAVDHVVRDLRRRAG